ncbi:MAG: MOSC domain-containing protein [Phycisphaerales bacterium]
MAAESSITPLGIVRALWLYPVKSMRGRAVDTVAAGWAGLEGDRRYAFVQTGDASGFPWATARNIPEMLKHEAYYTDPDRPAKSGVRIGVPDGRDLAVDDPSLAAALTESLGRPISLTRMNRGAFDNMPISLLTTTSVATIGADAGHESLDYRRFRPNVLIEPHESADGRTPEAGWAGQTIRFGETGAALRVDFRIKRCRVITLDPDSIERDQSVLDTVYEAHDGCAGVYATTVRPGAIRVGDVLRIERE